MMTVMGGMIIYASVAMLVIFLMAVVATRSGTSESTDRRLRSEELRRGAQFLGVTVFVALAVALTVGIAYVGTLIAGWA